MAAQGPPPFALPPAAVPPQPPSQPSQLTVGRAAGRRTQLAFPEPPGVVGALDGKPIGEFSDGLCSCCSDVGLCCCGCWCAPTLGPQLYERLVRTGALERIPGLSCVTLAVVLWLLFLVGNGLYGLPNPTAMTIGYTIELVGFVVLVCIVCTVRGAIRKRDGIAPTCCPGATDDCCEAFWCTPCSICRLFRHEDVYCEDYALCSTTGTRNELV